MKRPPILITSASDTVTITREPGSLWVWGLPEPYTFSFTTGSSE